MPTDVNGSPARLPDDGARRPSGARPDEAARASSGGIPVRDALDSATIPLRAAGVDTPRLDAEVLLAAAMGVDRAALHRDPDAELPGDVVRPFQAMVLRRRKREPVAYIVGTKGFRALELAVDARVIVPRPETELLVEVALGLPQGARVLDVGTGSGAVALALKDERLDLAITASDVSRRALEVARSNAERLGLDVAFVQSHLLDGVEGRFDAIVSNPPYIADAHGALLAPEITRHEPALGLFAGPDGLELIRDLVPAAAQRTGWLALEIGAGQADAVQALLGEAGLPTVKRHRDLAGIERVLVAQR
jgi:release factor glutamine methyltransferase